jgi:hypothetical protein
MTASNARRARFAVESLEGRDMMSATLAAAMPEPAELQYELENVLISSYSVSAAGTHALYQDIFIPANQSPVGQGGGGAGKVVLQDIHFAVDPSPESRRKGSEIEIISWGAVGGLEGMTDLAGVPVDNGVEGPTIATYDLKTAKK